MFRAQKGQASLEYVLIIIIVIGAFIAMSLYMKRGIQGRWKASIDDIGDQYDPDKANTIINHIIVSESNTVISTVNAAGGFWTERFDNSVTNEDRRGFTQVK